MRTIKLNLLIRKLRLLAMAEVGAILLIVLHTEYVAADLNFNGYLWSCNPSVCYLKDPINILFDILGWTDQGGGNLSFVDHSVLEDMQAQRASGCLVCSRYHQRYNQGNDDGGPDGVYGQWGRSITKT